MLSAYSCARVKIIFAYSFCVQLYIFLVVQLYMYWIFEIHLYWFLFLVHLFLKFWHIFCIHLFYWHILLKLLHPPPFVFFHKEKYSSIFFNGDKIPGLHVIYSLQISSCESFSSVLLWLSFDSYSIFLAVIFGLYFEDSILKLLCIICTIYL